MFLKHAMGLLLLEFEACFLILGWCLWRRERRDKTLVGKNCLLFGCFVLFGSRHFIQFIIESFNFMLVDSTIDLN